MKFYCTMSVSKPLVSLVVLTEVAEDICWFLYDCYVFIIR